MKKGISPLIAAVILIAFVIVVAGIASGFFTGFIQQRQSEISKEGEKTVDCTMAGFKINPDTITTNVDDPDAIDGDNFTEVEFTVYNSDETTLSNWTVTVFDNESKTNSTALVQSLGPGESYHFTNNTIETAQEFYPVKKIRVSTMECPRVESVAKHSTGGWELIYT